MPESVPNYLTVDADGNVGANFSGRLTAAGIDFNAHPAPEIGLLDSDEIVQWVRESNGAQVARIGAYEGDGFPAETDILQIRGMGGVEINANEEARLQIYQDPGSAISAHVASAGNFDRIILSSNGSSGFLKLANTQNLAMAIGTRTVAVAAGWGTYQVALSAALVTASMAFYSIRPTSGASIGGSEQAAFNNLVSNIDINSAVAQNVTIFVAVLGTL